MSSFTARYTRSPDRVLAVVWPPRRRRLRQLQALVDAGGPTIEREVGRVILDLTLYGNAYVRRALPPDDEHEARDDPEHDQHGH